MSKGDNSPGISRLASIMLSLAKDNETGSPVIDFGVVQRDGSLLTNAYPIAIPQTDYLVCRSCVLPNTEIVDKVNVARPSQRCLKSGDRVLVVWVHNDAVVIDIIKPAIGSVE